MVQVSSRVHARYPDSISKTQLQQLDTVVVEHAALFDAVPAYVGLKRPKHHFLSHLSMDIWRFGPMRGYWTYGFEAFNAILKAGANCTNYKSPVVDVMRYWSMRFGRRMGRSRCAG